MSIASTMHELIQPGETIVLAGKRGGGKTATAVSMVQHSIAGDWGHKNVYCITNVLFGRVVGHGHQPIEDYPDRIFHEDTLAGTMRRIGEIIGSEGSGNAVVIWLLDEAQNFMLADLNGSKENLALTKYLGNARKFDVCNLFLTPSVNNLTPRVRCFPVGDSKSGYCSARLQKDPARAAKLVHGRTDPRSVTWIQTDPNDDPRPVVINPTSWTRGIYGENAEGAYGYDTKSTASFSVGTNAAGVPFSFDDFIRATSGGLSHELPGKIAAFFEKWDALDEDGEGGASSHIDDQCKRIERMREFGLKWNEIAQVEGEPMTTLHTRYSNWSKKTAKASRSPKSERSCETCVDIQSNENPSKGREVVAEGGS